MRKKFSMKKEGGFYRITAIRDFKNVKKGTVGGLIEREENLSHDLDCWIHKDAKVCDFANISGYAQIYGHAVISNDACVTGYALIYDHVKISGNAQIHGGTCCNGEMRICGGVWDEAPLYIKGSNMAMTNCKNGYIAIGNEIRSFNDWKKTYKDFFQTGRQIKEGGEHIKYMIKMGV